MELIRLKGVTKEYRNRAVLSNVNLTIEEGDIVGVIGQSGSGKTTLLNLITGFISPSEGETVYYTVSNHEERNLNRNLNRIKSQIGFTPQHNSFYHKLTVKENLWHFGRLYGLDKERLATNIKNLLNFTRLIDHQDKLAEELSGGMQKRLDISCSLVHKPKVLVLDEPTADLDPILQKEIVHMLREINKQGVTIVIASHQLDCIENVCNKVIIVHQGMVKKFGSLEEVRRPFFRDHFTINVDPGENKEHLIQRLSRFPIKKIVDKGHTLTIYPKDVEETMSKLLELIKEENLYLHDMHIKKPSLIEVFESVVLDKQ